MAGGRPLFRGASTLPGRWDRGGLVQAMRIYLDMCCIQRPLDDKGQVRIQVEAAAVESIIALCELGRADLVSSDALIHETRQNPHPSRRSHAFDVLRKAPVHVDLSPSVEQRARHWNEAGLKPFDALHLACAEEAGADYFCTCDDRLLKRARIIHSRLLRILNPLELLVEVGP